MQFKGCFYKMSAHTAKLLWKINLYLSKYIKKATAATRPNIVGGRFITVQFIKPSYNIYFYIKMTVLYLQKTICLDTVVAECVNRHHFK